MTQKCVYVIAASMRRENYVWLNKCDLIVQYIYIKSISTTILYIEQLIQGNA